MENNQCSITNLCKCGCGKEHSGKINQTTQNPIQFIKEHQFRNKKHSLESRQKMKISILNNPRRYWLNKKLPSELIQKRTKSMQYHYSTIGIKHSFKMRERWRGLSDNDKISQMMPIKKWWDGLTKHQKIQHKSKILKSLFKRPTSLECKFQKICNMYNLNFIYVGDGKKFIGKYNPDFIDEKKRILVEVFYDWFKIKGYGSVDEYIIFRGNYFKKYDYDTMFFDKNELKYPSKVYEKIKNFMNVI